MAMDNVKLLAPKGSHRKQGICYLNNLLHSYQLIRILRNRYRLEKKMYGHDYEMRDILGSSRLFSKNGLSDVHIRNLEISSLYYG